MSVDSSVAGGERGDSDDVDDHAAADHVAIRRGQGTSPTSDPEALAATSAQDVQRGGNRGPKRRLIVVGLVLVGAFGFLLWKGLGGSLDYFETVDQAMSQKAMLGDKTFRLEGLVEPGSRKTIPGGVEFVAQGTKYSVTVVNRGNPPQLFQDDIPVVVVGHFSGSTFVSDQLIVDHSSQYIEQHPARVTAPNGSVR